MTSPLTYRPATFVPVPRWRRWWPLARQTATALFRSKWGVAMFCVCMIPALIRLAMLLIIFGVVSFGPPSMRNRMQSRATGEFAAVDPRRVEFYVDSVLAVMPGMVFALLLTTLVAARAIASDRATNALELYWTRGVSPWSYVLAKWVGSLLLVGSITVYAPFALWTVAVFLAPDWTLFLDTWQPLLLALAGLFVATAIWTALAVLISASCARPNTAMVVWSVLLVGSTAVGVVAAAALRQPDLRSTLSIWDAGGVVARAIGGLAPPRRVSSAGALVTLGVVLLLAWLQARRRMRLTEAIG